MSSAVAAIPRLGSGLGYRGEVRDEILAAQGEIDFVEVITDQFAGDARGLDQLRSLCDVFTVIPHGICLSIGSANGIDRDYLKRIKQAGDLTEAPYYSEHLCLTRAPGLEVGHLSPLALTESVLAQTIANVRLVQDTLEKPLVLENVTYLFPIPEPQMSQGEFFTRLVEATDCGVLLDVTNVYINSTNHSFDPRQFLATMPLANIVQIHLAGGRWSDDILVDSHSEPIQDDTWNLLEHLASQTPIRAAIVEHDANFPETLRPILDQVHRARQIIEGDSADG